MSAQVIFLAAFGLAAVWFGIVVFRTHSMVRSALALLFSQTAIGAMFLVMETEFLGVLQIMMMATEMSIMAIFMVMFMMDPGGLGEMDMKHQRKLSLGAGIVAFGGALLVAVFANWGPLPASIPDGGAQLRLLGVELLSRSMLIFESAGLTILTAMIAATAVAVQPARRPEPAMAGGTGGHDHGAGGHGAGGHGGAMASTGQDRHAAHDAHHDHAAHGGEHGQGHEQARHGTGKYTCPMHPEVVSDEPGSCPECGMDLVPVGGDHSGHGHEHHHDASAQYTCPMHPEVVSDEPGSCPKCGMDLVPVDGAEQAGHGHEHHHDAAAQYTCPMHREVVSDEPGSCPECGMNLVPVEGAKQAGHGHEHHHGAAAQYTCPMHPEVTSDEPGSCPKCGMDLVPVGGDDHGGHGGHSHKGHKP